jgi:cytochrome P450
VTGAIKRHSVPWSMATPPENKVTDTGAVSILEVLDNMEHYNVNTIYDKAPTLQWLMALASVSILFSIVRFSLLSLRPRNFPPGPRAWPFIGNVHHFASLKPFLQFTDLSSRYGDIVGLKAGPTNIVVLNSPEVCRELLEKRGAIYSGRPFGFIEREYVILDSQHFVFAPYDDYHRRCRSAMRILLGPTGLGRVAPLQDAAAAYFVKSLASTPAEIHNHLHNWGISVPLTAICGHRGAQKDPEMIASFYKNQKRWCEILTPGLAPPVEILPFLKYLPECLARWKRTARDIRRKQRQWFYMMLDTAKKELQRRSNDPQDTTSYFEPLMVTLLRQRQLEKGVFEDDQLAYLCGTIFDAAVDTTHSSALTFVKCLTAYPQVLKRAQAEIDDICGLNRPPGPQDMTKMRYLKACWLEASSSILESCLVTDLGPGSPLAPCDRCQPPSRVGRRRYLPRVSHPQRHDCASKFMGHISRPGLVRFTISLQP